MALTKWLRWGDRERARVGRGSPARRRRSFPLSLEALEGRLLLSIDIRSFPLRTKDLIYDATGDLIYASVPGSAGKTGNSITPIDPYSAQVGDSVFVGSEPGKLAASDDGEFLYVALDGAGAIRRFNIPSQTADIQFSLGPGIFAEELSVMPGNSSALAVSLRNNCCSPRHEGVALYDDGVARPIRTPGHTGSNTMVFGGSPDRLYGYNNETTDFGFRRMNIDETGIRIADATGGLISGFNVRIQYGGGWIFSTSGKAIDPEPAVGPPQLMGTYAGVGFGSAVAPDADNDRVYFLTGNQLMEYRLSAFTLVASYNLPSGGGSLIRWGTNGLAYQNGTHVFLITIIDDASVGSRASIVATPDLLLSTATAPRKWEYRSDFVANPANWTPASLRMDVLAKPIVSAPASTESSSLASGEAQAVRCNVSLCTGRADFALDVAGECWLASF